MSWLELVQAALCVEPGISTVRQDDMSVYNFQPLLGISLPVGAAGLACPVASCS